MSITGDSRVIDLETTTYNQVVSRDGIVLVDCWARWCKACSSLTPAYEQIANRYPSHCFAKLDAEANRGLIESLGVTHLPSLILYRDGYLLFKQAGVFEIDGLEDIVSQAESIDMELVRAELEKVTS